MKKVILCLLLLIPILVILTIDASGKLIASALVDIPVESVVIKHGGEVLESGDIYLEDYKDTQKKYTVFCEVFPGIATDEMIWESSDTRVATVTADPKRKEAADIRFLDYGSVDITCTSKKNSSISARATLYVGGLVPGYMTMGDYQGHTFTEVTVPRYAVTSLLATVKPAQSVREQKIMWSSADPAVVKVDNNGVITAVAHGETTVTATVTAKGKTVSATVTVKVAGNALSKQKVVYAAETSVSLSSYKTDEYVTIDEEEADLSSIVAFDAKEVVFRKGDARETVYVVRLPQLKSLCIENYYALKEGALSAFIARGTSNIMLNAVATDGSSPAVEWRSTDESVLTFVGNRLYAVGSGKAEIYPYAEGYASQRITLNVTNAVEDFRLSENAYRDKAGLLQGRVFGNLTYQNGSYTSAYALKILSVYPVDAGIESFLFESSDRDIATVDATGVVHFAGDVNGRDVAITATAYNQQGMPVRQNYIFHLVNGVNVGVFAGNQHFDAQAGEKPSFDPYFELKAVASDRSVKSIVLHSDVYFPSASEGGAAIKNLCASIYGNGKKLDGQFLINSVEDPDKLLLWDFPSFTDMPQNLSVQLINLNMQSTQPTSDDAKAAFEELSAKGGGAIGTMGAYPNANNTFFLFVKGCLFQYAYGHVNLAIGDSAFEGCIFRNNSASAIVLQQSAFGVANAKIKNCIFSNTIAPVGIACGNFNDLLYNMKQSKEKNKVKPQFGTFELEGNNYVYNWKKLEEVQMDLLPRDLEDSTANSLVGQFNSILGKVIREAFMMSSDDNLYVDENEEKWLNFSFLMIGIWADLNPQINDPSSTENGIKVVFDPEVYQMLEVHAERAPTLKSPIVSAAAEIGIDIKNNMTYHIVCRDKDGTFNTVPGETYTIGDQVYARLRGEAA